MLILDSAMRKFDLAGAGATPITLGFQRLRKAPAGLRAVQAHMRASRRFPRNGNASSKPDG